MSGAALDRAARAAGARIIAAIVARFRDLDLAQEAFSEACARAAEAWPRDGEPQETAAWLYRVALRCALDALRRRRVRERLAPDLPPDAADPASLTEDAGLIPDERLRLVFVCCHPAVAAEARAALTLRVVCGLSTRQIARAFLVSEPTLAQRLVRAKRKIAEAGVPFEIPGPGAWPERLEAILCTLEVAYAKAHEDAAGGGPQAGYAAEMLYLTRVLAELLPAEPEVLAFAALVRYAEARRPARVDAAGAMVPLSEQDPRLWQRPLIEAADAYLARIAAGGMGTRVLQAAIHGVWSARPSLAEPPPWVRVLALYDALLERRDDAVVRLNRAVALAEVSGPGAALAEINSLDGLGFAAFLPYHAVRADLLRRCGHRAEAIAAYDAALALDPAPAERLWLARRRDELNAG